MNIDSMARGLRRARLTIGSGYAPNLSEPPEWTKGAACQSIGGDLWYPEEGASSAAAKEICRLCAVRAECLEYALETRDAWGIYGGLTARERSRLRRGVA